MSYWENTRKPAGLGGKMLVSLMNVGHRALADWGLRYALLPEGAAILDCGCGGGANLARLLQKYPHGRADGSDYSAVSVESSQKLNRKAADDGRCTILQASAAALPFADAQYDLVTAFETVYFWGDTAQCFREVCRVLKPGGTFLICNECGGENPKDEKWTEKIDGMTIYSEVQLKAALEESGLCEMQVHRNQKRWLCVTARKSL